VRACWPAHIPTPVVLASARVRVRSICASRARQARSELDALYHQAWLQKNAGLQKQTNKQICWMTLLLQWLLHDFTIRKTW
jgi:hypothetical protein